MIEEREVGAREPVLQVPGQVPASSSRLDHESLRAAGRNRAPAHFTSAREAQVPVLSSPELCRPGTAGFRDQSLDLSFLTLPPLSPHPSLFHGATL